MADGAMLVKRAMRRLPYPTHKRVRFHYEPHLLHDGEVWPNSLKVRLSGA